MATIDNGREEQGKIIIYQTDDGRTKIDVRFENDTVWLTLNQMTELFGRDKSTISRHIKNIFSEGELVREAVVAKNATTASQTVDMFCTVRSQS